MKAYFSSTPKIQQGNELLDFTIMILVAVLIIGSTVMVANMKKAQSMKDEQK
jgi:hypothetical protein